MSLITYKDLGISPFKAVVCIITNVKGEILLGHSLSDDWRYGKMCFVGGHIDKGESHDMTAVREAFEEASIVCDVNSCQCHHFDDIPEVCFVTLKHFCGNEQPNNEFEYLAFYDVNDLPLETHPQNIEILRRIGYIK